MEAATEPEPRPDDEPGIWRMLFAVMGLVILLLPCH
jgi:hypothetical protein